MAQTEVTNDFSALKGDNQASRKRHYETTFIVTPTLSDVQTKEIADKNVKTIEQFQGVMLRQDDWGKKRMAHPIEKHQVGRYFYFRYVAGAESVREFERNLKLDAQVIRFMTVKLSEPLSKDEIAQLVEKAPKEISSSPSIRQEEDELEGPSYANA